MKPVTQALITDAAELTQLVNMAYRGDESRKGWTTEAHLLDGQRTDQEIITNYLTEPGVTILKYTTDDNRIIGCVYLQNRHPKLYLGMLTVMPEQQANGIGRQLLHEAELHAYAVGCNVITMTVISSRRELLDWYIRRGYQPTGEILPFHADKRFGIPRTAIQLLVLEKEI